MPDRNKVDVKCAAKKVDALKALKEKISKVAAGRHPASDFNNIFQKYAHKCIEIDLRNGLFKRIKPTPSLIKHQIALSYTKINEVLRELFNTEEKYFYEYVKRLLENSDIALGEIALDNNYLNEKFKIVAFQVFSDQVFSDQVFSDQVFSEFFTYNNLVAEYWQHCRKMIYVAVRSYELFGARDALNFFKKACFGPFKEAKSDIAKKIRDSVKLTETETETEIEEKVLAYNDKEFNQLLKDLLQQDLGAGLVDSSKTREEELIQQPNIKPFLSSLALQDRNQQLSQQFNDNVRKYKRSRCCLNN